ncbi:MAG: amidohydrolase family protein [Holophaga sp.]|nr:amidohydrolase family protein [Holophaga sp.]
MHTSDVTRHCGLRWAGIALLALGMIPSAPAWAAGAPSGQAVPWSTGVAKPRIQVPPLATDCHHHIYDASFPPDPNTTLRPPDASVADYRLLQRRLGTTRQVIIQPSTYGVDNSGLLKALGAFGLETARGIAVVNPGVTDAELEKMDAAGVRGIRINTHMPGGATSIDMVLPLAQRIAKRGWHIEIVAAEEDIVKNADTWNRMPCAVVFDHLGNVTDVKNPAMGIIVKLMQQKKAWVKLSGPYILSKVGAPSYSDRTEVAKAFVKAAPGQVVWGSDWPHPTVSLDAKPDDAALMDLLAQWAPGKALRRRILVDNPARLYGFPTARN